MGRASSSSSSSSSFSLPQLWPCILLAIVPFVSSFVGGWTTRHPAAASRIAPANVADGTTSVVARHARHSTTLKHSRRYGPRDSDGGFDGEGGYGDDVDVDEDEYDGGDGEDATTNTTTNTNTNTSDGDGTTRTTSSSERSSTDAIRKRSKFASLLRELMRLDRGNDDNDDDGDGGKARIAALGERAALLARNVDVIMDVIGTATTRGGGGDGSNERVGDDQEDGGGRGRVLLEDIIAEEIEHMRRNDGIIDNDDDDDDGGAYMDRISDAIDEMLNFVESFAYETRDVDDNYKGLLRDIFVAISPAPSTSSSDAIDDVDEMGRRRRRTVSSEASSSSARSSSSYEMEGKLDDLLSSNIRSYTPGFLRHVEGEIRRLTSASNVSIDGVRMIQVLRMIQARVLEELGRDIGDGAIVLGQLLGYDDDDERSAVLDAGLAVRGAEFAIELIKLTEEALGDLRAMSSSSSSSSSSGGDDGGINVDVDPELVRRLEMIDGRIRTYIEKAEMDYQ